MRISIVERTPLRCLAYTGHPLSILPGLLTALLHFGGLAGASVAGDIDMLPDSASPNAEFGLAVGDLGAAERKPKEGEARYRALFIVELRTKRLLQEIEPFRRPPADPSPTYRAAWSSDSTHLGVVARFRRDSELEAYAISNSKWTRLELAQFDPLQDAQEKLKIEGPVTGES